MKIAYKVVSALNASVVVDSDRHTLIYRINMKTVPREIVYYLGCVEEHQLGIFIFDDYWHAHQFGTTINCTGDTPYRIYECLVPGIRSPQYARKAVRDGCIMWDSTGMWAFPVGTYTAESCILLRRLPL